MGAAVGATRCKEATMVKSKEKGKEKPAQSGGSAADRHEEAECEEEKLGGRKRAKECRARRGTRATMVGGN